MKTDQWVTIQSKLPCDKCDSSDAVTERVNLSTGTTIRNCFSCDGSYKVETDGDDNGLLTESAKARPLDQYCDDTDTDQSSIEKQLTLNQDIKSFLTYPIRSLPDRSIKLSTADYYGVRVIPDEYDVMQTSAVLFPYFKNHKLSAFKSKSKQKEIHWRGKSDKINFFGQHLFTSGKTLYITEGEEDAMVLWQVLREHSNIPWNPAVVSISTGAGKQVLKNFADNWEWLDGFDRVVIVFDSDVIGEAARETVCEALGTKAYFVSLPEKDCCDMVSEGKAKDMYWLAMKPQKYVPVDVYQEYDDLRKLYQATNQTKSFPYPSWMPELQQKTQGAQEGSLILIPAATSAGKSTFKRAMQVHHLETLPKEYKIADISIEEQIPDTMTSMMEMKLGKRFTRQGVNASEQEKDQVFDELFKEGRMTFYDYNSDGSIDTIMSKLKWLAMTGHKVIWLDHITAVIDMDDSAVSERKKIDTLMYKLMAFVKETKTVMFVVCHVRKADNSSRTFEQGHPVSLDDLRGSGSLKQAAFTVIALQRNLLHEDESVRTRVGIHVLKCRHTGDTGRADCLMFDPKTSNYSKVPYPSEGFY